MSANNDQNKDNRENPTHEPYVLIVDDNDQERMLYAIYLAKRGFTIVDVNRAQQALDLIEEKMPGLVLLDILMPGMHGLEALVRLRKKYSAVELPVILLTGLGGDADRLRGLELGATDYLIKPVYLDDLVQLVRMHLRARSVPTG